MPTRARLLVCVAVAAAGAAISACGGGGGGASSDDPASLAPADAPLYIQGILRPHGRLKRNVEGLAQAVSGLDDPTGALITQIDDSLNDEPTVSGRQLSFAKDIDPWLGERAGLFVEDLQKDDPPAVGIVEATDADAAQKFVEDSKRKGDKDRSYKGVAYVLDTGDDTAAAVIDDFLVVGNESAFKDAVDVSKGSESLGDQSEFTDTLDQASSGSFADAYFSLEAITDEIRIDDPQGAKGFQSVVGDTSSKTVLASLVPSSDSAELDVSTNAEGQALQLADLSSLISSFPAESFAAIGTPDLGETVNKTIDRLEQSGIPGVSRERIDQQLAETGLSLDDITAALGDLGAFAEGSDQRSLQGAAVITAKDPEKAKELITKLKQVTAAAQLSGARGIGPAPVGEGISITDRAELGPQPLIVTTEGDRIVIGYGKQATVEALSGGGGTLADDPTYKQAVDGLGRSGVSAYFSLSKIFELADATGALRDPDYVKARPYLDKLTYAILGSGEQGDFVNSKVIVGVKR